MSRYAVVDGHVYWYPTAHHVPASARPVNRRNPAERRALRQCAKYRWPDGHKVSA